MKTLEVRKITKRFPGVTALQAVELQVQTGQVLALIGENGAGKSTLMKILAGVQRPDEGSILLDGEPVQFHNVQTAQRAGIALIHQELNLLDNLDIGANIFLGREPRALGIIDNGAIHKQSTQFLQQVGLNLPPTTPVRNLTIAQQQLVEIARALSVNAQFIIMDEPTSSLTTRETENLFNVVEQLKSNGVGIIYISHRLAEVKHLADHVTVFRDGQNAGELSRDQITHQQMVKLMVGRDLSSLYSRHAHQPGNQVLQVCNLVTRENPKYQVNFSIQAGEIVGLAGLVGAGRSELLHAIFGHTRPLSGTIEIDKQIAKIRSPQDAIQSGLALVPEDRKQQGVILELAVRWNISLASLKNHQIAGLLNQGYERKASAETIQSLKIKTPNDSQLVQYLSGGNQQKVVIGKWLLMKPKVLLLDEPTRGIDIGAKHEIYDLMDRLASDGTAILFASSEMEEIMGMSDRVIVMHEGRLAGELSKDNATEEAIMNLATSSELLV